MPEAAANAQARASIEAERLLGTHGVRLWMEALASGSLLLRVETDTDGVGLTPPHNLPLPAIESLLLLCARTHRLRGPRCDYETWASRAYVAPSYRRLGRDAGYGEEYAFDVATREALVEVLGPRLMSTLEALAAERLITPIGTVQESSNFAPHGADTFR